MRQSIGGTWTLQLMIIFILIYVGYITLTLSYSRTTKMKNEVIAMVEKYEGINSNSIELVNNYLMTVNYGAMGVCGDISGETYGVNLNNNTAEKINITNKNNKYNYCIKRYKGTGRTHYYQVTLFFKFNIPFLGDLSSFTVKGSTSNFESNDDKNIVRS